MAVIDPGILRLHHSLFTVDTHVDTPLSLRWKGFDIGRAHPAATLLGGDLDLPRMAQGGLAAAFFAVWVSQGPCTEDGRAQARTFADAIFANLDRMFRDHADQCGLARTPEEGRRLHASGRRAIFLGMENGYPLGLDVDRLDEYHARGIRYLTLCHIADNDLCASCTAPGPQGMGPRTTPDTGLTELGARVVARANRLGMMIDVSHVSERTVADVLAVSKAPVLASHSGARSVGDHPRNLRDEELRAIAAGGGVVQVCFVPEFVRPERQDPAADQELNALFRKAKTLYADRAIGADPAADAALEREFDELKARRPLPAVTVAEVADHVDHVVRVAGIDHVGIGTDFDGGGRVRDCQDVAELPNLTAELARRGYSEADLARIWGGNVMRVFQENLDLAR